MHKHISMIAAFHHHRTPIAKAERLPEELKGTSHSAEHLCTQYQRKVSTESAEGKINSPVRSPAFVKQTSCLHILGCIERRRRDCVRDLSPARPGCDAICAVARGLRRRGSHRWCRRARVCSVGVRFVGEPVIITRFFFSIS